MKKKNILVTGASGLLGGNLCYLFNSKGFNVTGVTNRQKVGIPNVSMINVQEIDRAHTEFEFIIHCAAMTNVDECEKNPTEAYEVNVNFTESLIDFANKKNALLIHISTDAVYKDGPQPRHEKTAVEPLNIYARTKLQAEERVLQNANDFFVFRTNLFGYNILNKFSLAEWVYYNVSSGTTISGFYDVFFSPILVNDLFDVIVHLINNRNGITNEVLNVGSAKGFSKYEFAVRIANLFGLDSSLIRKTSVADFGFTAPRTNNTLMDCKKFETSFNYKLPSLEEGLQKFYDLHQQGYPQLLKNFNIN
jgi:dTDP-4-dehydrorhamnose reductase